MYLSKIYIDALVAVGTLLIAVMAIWGDWFRYHLAPQPKLIIEPDIRGDTVNLGDPKNPTKGMKGMIFHLKVVNNSWVPANDCHVMLRGISRRGPDGQFYPVPMSIPLQFVWAPGEITPPSITLIKEQILDLGIITETADKFVPRLYWYPRDFQGNVGKNEVVHYKLEIEATNFTSPRYQVFEVAWDGIWESEPEKMEQHIRIKEIKGP